MVAVEDEEIRAPDAHPLRTFIADHVTAFI
jgi:hypothetical protein